VQCLPPVRAGEDAGGDVGDEHRGQPDQDVLDAVEAAAGHQRCHHHGGDGDGEVAADTEQLEARGDPGQFGAGGADVGQHERCFVKGAPDVLATRADRYLGNDGVAPFDRAARVAYAAATALLGKQGMRVLAMGVEDLDAEGFDPGQDLTTR
jgi:hypothetical protein